jgi:hypothetical protein
MKIDVIVEEEVGMAGQSVVVEEEVVMEVKTVVEEAAEEITEVEAAAADSIAEEEEEEARVSYLLCGGIFFDGGSIDKVLTYLIDPQLARLLRMM